MRASLIQLGRRAAAPAPTKAGSALPGRVPRQEGAKAPTTMYWGNRPARPKKMDYFPNHTMKLVRASAVQQRLPGGVLPPGPHPEEVDGVKKVQLRMAPNINKREIENYMEKIYGVDVSKVNVMNYEGGLARKQHGWWVKRYSDYKKAIVTLEEPAVIPMENVQPKDREKYDSLRQGQYLRPRHRIVTLKNPPQTA